MKKQLLALALLSVSGLASAAKVPPSYAEGNLFHPSQLGGYPSSYPSFSGADTGTDLFSLKDLTGNDATATLKLELAGDKDINSFGIYQAGNGSNRLEIFAGTDSVGDDLVTIKWLANGDVCIDANGCVSSVVNNIDKQQFGFYVSNNTGTFYSESGLNNGQDQMLSFFLNGVAGFDFMLAFEDRYLNAGSDKDYNDMVIGMHDIMPSSVNPGEVPVPGAVWLFGSALMGYLGMSRRKTQVISA